MTVKMPKPIIRGIQILQTHVKFMLKITFCLCLRVLNLWRQGFSYKKKNQILGRDDPCPALVAVPLMSSVGGSRELIKKKLPITKFGRFLEKLDAEEGEIEEYYCHYQCVICRHGLESGHEIRELSNCCHAFHSGCLDGWVDEGHVSCPLCRSKLLPHNNYNNNSNNPGGDQWREERIAYLFGEGCDISVSLW